MHNLAWNICHLTVSNLSPDIALYSMENVTLYIFSPIKITRDTPPLTENKEKTESEYINSNILMFCIE